MAVQKGGRTRRSAPTDPPSPQIMTTILDRYILKELCVPFFIGLGILCFIVLTKEMLRLVELLVTNGVGLLVVLEIIVNLMPSFLVLTLPMACLIASITTFSRFSFDKELVAMRTAGLSLLRIAVPVFVFSLFVFLATLFLSQWGQPWSFISLKKLAISLIQDQLHLALERGAFNEPADNLMIFVPRPEPGEQARGIFILDQRDPDKKIIVTAQTFRMLKNPQRKQFGIRLHDGEIHHVPKDGPQHHQVAFSTYDFKIDLSPALNVATPKRPDYQDIVAALEKSGWRDTTMLRRLMEYYKDLGFPVATLILGVLGMPVGIVSKRAGRMRGFVLGMFIMVGYYLLNVLGEFSVTALFLHPFAGAWLPNVTLLLITGILFHQASRR